MITWRSDIENAPRDGTQILLSDFEMDYHHDGVSLVDGETDGDCWERIEPNGDCIVPNVIVGYFELNWQGGSWRYCSYDGGTYGVIMDPKIWAEINTPTPKEGS
jgi:hypothetical protein